MDMFQNKVQNTSLGGDAVRLTFSKVISLCAVMLTTMLLSRYRSFQEYGTYSQLLLVVNLVSSLLMIGLPNSINFFLSRAETQDEQKKFLSVYYVLSTIISIVIGVALIAAIPLIERYFSNGTIRFFYYFLAFYPWAHIISSTIENVLIVYQKTKNIIIYRMIYSLAILGCVIGVQWLGFGFSTYMVSFVVVNCVFALMVYFISFRLCGGFSLEFDTDLVKKIFVFSVPMGLASVIGTFNIEIDKLLIGYLMDTEQFAIYTNAAKELPLTIVASSITAVLLPRLTRMIKHGRSNDAIKLWGYATELSLIVVSVIVFGVITFAEEAMTILYSAKYLSGVSVFRVYTLVLLMRVTYFGMVLNAYGQSKKILCCSVLSLFLNVILNPLCFWCFGIVGPAIATLVVIFFIQQFQLIMTANIANVSFTKVFPWRRYGLTIIVNTVFGIVFWTLKQMLPLEQVTGDVVESLLLGVIWCLLYLVVMKRRIFEVWHLLNAA